MCQVLHVSESGYYKWRIDPIGKRGHQDLELLKEIKEVHKKSRETYGVLRIKKALERKGIVCSVNKVARIKRQNGIYAKTRRRFKATTNSRHNFPVADNILNRNFKVSKPNAAWVADLTYIGTDEGWLYLAAVEDLCHRQPVGYAMGETMSRELVIKALEKGIASKQPGKGLICHSDRGSQVRQEVA
jgi:transposase InsO family protein